MAQSNETVVITGGGSGIGKATAEALSDQSRTIIIADIDQDSANKTASNLSKEGQTHAIQTDVTNLQDVKNLSSFAKNEYGGINSMVNCAGISQSPEPISEQDIEYWERIMDIHVKGTYLCSKIAWEQMKEQEVGNIINMSSIAGYGAFPQRTAYSPAKSAIKMLTKVFAVEGAKQNIRVNAVAPGYVRTSLVDELIDNGDIDVDGLKQRTPMGRLATPDDVAKTIKFLLSSDADYITGITLPVDGGWTAYGHV